MHSTADSYAEGINNGVTYLVSIETLYNMNISIMYKVTCLKMEIILGILKQHKAAVQAFI